MPRTEAMTNALMMDGRKLISLLNERNKGRVFGLYVGTEEGTPVIGLRAEIKRME